MEPYVKPLVVEDLMETVVDMVSKRQEDIEDFTNLSSVLISGRKVDKIPTSSSDISPSDREGDVNWTATYLYVAVPSGGNIAWRRVALSSF